MTAAAPGQASRVFAIDLGGTKVQTALVDPQGRASRRAVEPARWGRDGADAAEQVLALAEGAVRGDPGIAAIGLAATGVFDALGCVRVGRPDRRGWAGTPIRDMLERRCGVPAAAGNDVQLTAFGEARYGIGRGARLLLAVAIGTGLGGGIVADGRLVTGAGGAGEIGHVSIDMAGLPCGCGGRGCVERYVSGPALARRYRKRTGVDARAERVMDLADRGDTAAASLVDDVVSELAAALGSVCAVLDPDRVVVGGGLGMRLAARLPEVAARLLARGPFHHPMEVTPASLGTAAPLCGAGALAWERVGTPAPADRQSAGEVDGNPGLGVE